MSTALSVCHGAFGRAALYRLDKSLITHAHREGHLIFHIEGSFSEMTVNNSHHAVDHDHAVAVSPLEPHCFNINDNEPSVVLVLYIKPIWFLENSHTTEFTLSFGSSQIVRTESINSVVRNVISLILNNDGKQDIDTLLFSLCRLCYDQSWHSVTAPGLLQNKSLGFSDYRIHRSLQTMQNRLSADVEMGGIARAVGLSRPHFFKLFKKQLGVTPNIYLNTLRSERAIYELVNSNKSVTSIAHDLGYSSQAAFTRFFSSNVGVAPSEYRRVAVNPSA